MSFTFSRALVEAFSLAISSAGDASAPSNSTPTPDLSWWPDRTTEHSRLSRFGMTCGPLTADRGAALLTWWLEASRARTSASPTPTARPTRDGLDGERSGLWSEFKRIIREVRPDELRWRTAQGCLFSGAPDSARILGDLAELGFDARWGVLGAAGVGAPHERDRLWIGADARGEHEQGQFAGSTHAQEWQEPGARQAGSLRDGYRRWPAQPGVRRVADGMAHRADRLKAAGNGQVPAVAATAWNLLKEPA
jgi:hypothetical protein